MSDKLNKRNHVGEMSFLIMLCKAYTRLLQRA